MTINIAKNTTAGAPALNGQTGTLISVLDFALVTTAGWSKVYSGTNKAVYRAPTGNRRYLRVDDSSGVGARIVGYESMTDVDTGTGAFPTNTQLSGGLHLYKSSTADTTARPWALIERNGLFYFWIGPSCTTPNNPSGTPSLYVFGDFVSYKSADVYNTVIAASPTSTETATSMATSDVSANTSSNTNGLYICRSHTQIGSAVTAARLVTHSYGNAQTYMGYAGPPYPSPIDGGLHMSKVHLSETNQGIRGIFSGLYSPLHNNALAHGDTFTGSGDFAGKTFEVFRMYVSGGTGQCFIETSDTWGN